MVQDPISKENKHIEEYLADYFERPDTEYAVMINGPWGTGKTWFVKQIKDKYNTIDHKKFYISLNGMRKTAAIDSEIIRILHPILGSKKVKVILKAVSQLVKGTTKIDLIGNDEDESINLSLPLFDISDLVELGKEVTIIFDDLERCQIPIKEVLGYINYFVEHQNLKVVIIADEEKIKEKDDYLSNKEKLIGTTFLLEGSYETAIDAFLEGKSLSKIKAKLIQNKEIIYDVYNNSGFKNLRSVKQTLQEFSRFYDEDYFNGQKGNELFTKVLKYFFIFSLEVRAGTFEDKILEFKEDVANEFEKEHINSLHRLFKNKPRRNFLDKYKIPEHEYYIFDMETWTDIIIFNKLNKEKINEQLFENFYKFLNEKPDWYKLWHFDDLNQEQFDNCIKNIIINLNNKNYTEIGEIKHVSGLLYFFYQKGLIEGHNLNDLKLLILDNVDAVFKNRDSFQKYLDDNESMMNTSWVSYSFYEIESDFVQEIFKKIKEMRDEQKRKNCKKDAPDILALVESKELSKLAQNLTMQNNSKGEFWNDPILSEINFEIFSLAIIDLNKEQIRSLTSTLYMRYEMSKSVYDIEREWLLKVIEYLENVILPRRIGVVTLKVSERILPNLYLIKKEMDFRYGLNSLSDDMSTL